MRTGITKGKMKYGLYPTDSTLLIANRTKGDFEVCFIFFNDFYSARETRIDLPKSKSNIPFISSIS